MRTNDWNDWYALLTVAQLGSFTRAAEQLGQPKSSVSVAVSRLEERLGQRLLERSTRRLRLTEAGAQLVEQAGPLFQRLDALAREAIAATDQPRGVLRLATPYEFGSLQLGEVICRVMATYPELEIELEVTSGDRLHPEAGYDIEFLITTRALPDSDQVARRIYSVGRKVFAAPALVARLGRPATPAELAHWPCITNQWEDEWRFLTPQGDSLALQPRGPLRTPNAAVRLQAVCAGLGAALMVPSYCRNAVAEGRLTPLLPDYPSAPRRIYAFLPERRLLPAKSRVFMQALETFLAEEEG